MILFPENQRGIPQNRQVFSRVLRLGLGTLLALAAAGFVWFTRREGPAPQVPVPADLAKFDPALRTYLAGQISWVKESPRDPHRQATLGMAYAANSLWAEAKVAFQNAASLRPNEPLPELYIAVATQELEGFGPALALYRELTKKYPDFAQGFYRLGDTALRAGAVDEAEPAFRELMRLAPAEWRGYAGLGEVRIRQNRFEEAATFLEKALQIDPEEKIIHHLLGLAYRGLGRKEEAERELRLGLKAEHYPMPDPWAASAPRHMKMVPDRLAMAREYSQIGRYDRAAQVLEETLATHPANTMVMNKLADAYLNAGAPDKAQSLLLRLIEFEPQNQTAFILLSTSCLDLNLLDQALTNAEHAVRLAPKLPAPHLAKATAFRALGRFEEALAEFEAAFRADPKNAFIPMEMGDVYLRALNRSSNALERYEQAIEIDPASFLVQIRLADLYIRMGDSNRAATALSKAEQLDSSKPVIEALRARWRQMIEK